MTSFEAAELFAAMARRGPVSPRTRSGRSSGRTTSSVSPTVAQRGPRSEYFAAARNSRRLRPSFTSATASNHPASAAAATRARSGTTPATGDPRRGTTPRRTPRSAPRPAEAQIRRNENAHRPLPETATASHEARPSSPSSANEPNPRWWETLLCGEGASRRLGAGSMYWDNKPVENVFMEVTDRDNIGGDLLAPVHARGGRGTGGYVLVPLVRAKHVVVHYDSGEEAIVGASLVVGDPEPEPIRWVARGASARAAGATEEWLPGVRVPLDHFVDVDPPIALAQIRARQNALMQIRADLVGEYGDRTSLYFPWVTYGEHGPIRTWQSYLTKLPQAAIDEFPRFRPPSPRPSARSTAHSTRLPGNCRRTTVAEAAGRLPGRSGQGFQVDAQVRVAVEAHAMNRATGYYAKNWDVEDVHGEESFDLRCTRPGVELHVEVKGTTTGGVR